MVDEEYSRDLFSIDKKAVSIHHINWWLMKYEKEFYDAIPKSSCGKWSKWVRDNSIHVFPCACHTREKDCIFIELYYKLLEVRKLNSQEEFYAEELIRFSGIKQSKESVIEWVRDNKSKYKNLKYRLDIDSIGVIIDVRINNHDEPSRVKMIKIDKKEFKHATEFKRIFDEMVFVDYI
ncbi:hypothetical protein [Winogradskyella helgolandensis]|uniref:hypothetical protein n=1 Tax=Winogradskyella helgolandensis TaxID=2697010 RepID=UPI0015CC48AF|nr:hypothetical protein [Winogradskyella helgolandensis]